MEWLRLLCLDWLARRHCHHHMRPEETAETGKQTYARLVSLGKATP
jgi:hypothetical protein